MCKCQPGWTGPTCQEPSDGCAIKHCYGGIALNLLFIFLQINLYCYLYKHKVAFIMDMNTVISDCTKKPASEIVSSDKRDYSCAPCPSGMTGDGTECHGMPQTTSYCTHLKNNSTSCFD